jgi:hypothetical protein
MNKQKYEETDLQRLLDLVAKLQLKVGFRLFSQNGLTLEKSRAIEENSSVSSDELPGTEKPAPLQTNNVIGYERTTINSILEKIILPRTGKLGSSRNRAGRGQRGERVPSEAFWRGADLPEGKQVFDLVR